MSSQNLYTYQEMSNGKGSRPRNNFSQKFRDNYDSIFKKKPSRGSITDVILQGRSKLIPADDPARLYTLVGSDRRIYTHHPSKCAGRHCCIHNPSDHHMKDWPQNWRDDRGIMERICPCGIGHPDPDDPKAKDPHESVHGCCGCCHTK